MRSHLGSSRLTEALPLPHANHDNDDIPRSLEGGEERSNPKGSPHRLRAERDDRSKLNGRASSRRTI
eukprot:3986103-Pyramimonas_sp.AAC.1